MYAAESASLASLMLVNKVLGCRTATVFQGGDMRDDGGTQTCVRWCAHRAPDGSVGILVSSEKPARPTLGRWSWGAPKSGAKSGSFVSPNEMRGSGRPGGNRIASRGADVPGRRFCYHSSYSRRTGERGRQATHLTQPVTKGGKKEAAKAASNPAAVDRRRLKGVTSEPAGGRGRVTHAESGSAAWRYWRDPSADAMPRAP